MTPNAQSLLKTRIKYLRGVRRYASPRPARYPEVLDEKGHPASFAGSPITVVNHHENDPHREETIRRFRDLFGEHSPEMEQRLAKAAGAMPGSKVSYGLGAYGGLGVTVDHPRLSAERTYYRDPTDPSQVVASHDWQTTSKSIQGGGVHRFAESIPHLQQLGVSKILTHGVGEHGSAANGYYTWGRYGFNAPLETHHLENLPPHIREELHRRGTHDLHTLFSIPGKDYKEDPATGQSLQRDEELGGAGAWRRYGKDIHSEFDLSPNSPHMKAFEEYHNARKNPAPVPVPGVPGPTPSAGGTSGHQRSGANAPGLGTPNPSGTPQQAPGTASENAGSARRQRIANLGIRPNTPMSRNAQSLLKYAKKPSPTYDPIVQHAAGALDDHSGTGLMAFADHLAESQHGDHPAVQAFTNWVINRGENGSWDNLAKEINPRYHEDLRGWFARAPYHEDVRDTPDKFSKLSDLDKPSARLYTFSQDNRHPTPDPVRGFGRNFGENHWYMVRPAPRNSALRKRISSKRKYTSAEVADHVYKNLGIRSLIQLLIGNHYYHPDRRKESRTGPVTFSKDSRKQEKPRRYAKVDGDVKAHPLIEGFPLEHALRHLANDPNNHTTIRDLAKTALTGVDRHGKDIPGGPSPALWVLHDALTEHGHPMLGHYNWMAAADKIQIDAKVRKALEHFADRNYHNTPQAQRDAVSGNYLNRYTPEGMARLAVDVNGKPKKGYLDAITAHVQKSDPTIEKKHVAESIQRHMHRAATKFLEQTSSTSAGHRKTDALLPKNLVSGYHKATRYAKPKNTSYKSPIVSSLTSAALFPEEQSRINKPENQEKYLGYLESAVHNKPGVLPTLNEVKALATYGQPVKGGYQTASNLVSHILRNPMDAHRFATATAILSPVSPWVAHTNNALRAVALWHQAGRPNDQKSLTKIFGRSYMKESVDPKTGRKSRGWAVDESVPHQMLRNGYFGIKPEKLKQLFSIPDSEYAGMMWPHMSEGANFKIQNFGLAHVDPRGKPVDTHMAKLFVPEEFLNTMHKMGFDLGSPEHEALSKPILDAQKSIANNPATALSYGTLMHHAAQEMGWEPREVQEAVWVATLAIMAAKAYGAQGASEVLDTFTPYALRQGWDMRPVLTDPELTDLLSNTFNLRPGEISEALDASDARRAFPLGAKARTSNLPALENATARLPAVLQPGAKPIVAATPRLAGTRPRKEGTEYSRRKEKPKKYALNRNDNFLDALRHISASNNLAPVADAIAKKMGAPGKAMPALHNTPRGSVPGVAMAVFGQQDPHAVHYLASQIALTNQKKNKGMLPPGVSVFHVRPEGPDSVYKFYQEGSGLDILEKMNRAGLTNRVLIPHHKGFNIVIPDKGSRQTKQIRGYQQTHGVPMQKSRGYLKSIGSPDASQARDQFRSGVVAGSGE